MFIEIKNADGNVELLNTAHIVKVMDGGHKGRRINMADGSYIWTQLHVDDLWEQIGEDGE